MTQSSSRDHSSISSSSWLGCSTVGRWGSIALCLELVLTPGASYFQLWLELNWNWLTDQPELTQTDSRRLCQLVILIVCRPHAYCGRTHLQPCPQVKVIFRCVRPDSTCYLHRCISWLTARSRVYMLTILLFAFFQIYYYYFCCWTICITESFHRSPELFSVF